ncbi:hypothetical protein SynPROSU1_00709 [Synechococcus sp. PROS-U-1]|nr:hypothetical protein SynPROSU1_00709 [Synechococcus sp. PROS-U-1]
MDEPCKTKRANLWKSLLQSSSLRGWLAETCCCLHPCGQTTGLSLQTLQRALLPKLVQRLVNSRRRCGLDGCDQSIDRGST